MTFIRREVSVIFLPLFSHVLRCSSIPECQIALQAALWSFVRVSRRKACHQILPAEFVVLNMNITGLESKLQCFDVLVDNGKASLLRTQGQQNSPHYQVASHVMNP